MAAEVTVDAMIRGYHASTETSGVHAVDSEQLTCKRAIHLPSTTPTHDVIVPTIYICSFYFAVVRPYVKTAKVCTMRKFPAIGYQIIHLQIGLLVF